MNIVELPISKLVPAPWNPNSMDTSMLGRLTTSLRTYGLVSPFVVRPFGKVFEVLSGNQRRQVTEELGFKTLPCIVVDLDDAHARLLAQALNHVRGEDDLGLRAVLLRTVLEQVPERDVLAVLPESSVSLQQLASLGQQGMADYLRSSERARAARLTHFSAQLTAEQSELVQNVIGLFLPEVSPGEEGNPNRTGLALVHLCRDYLRLRGDG